MSIFGSIIHRIVQFAEAAPQAAPPPSGVAETPAGTSTEETPAAATEASGSSGATTPALASVDIGSVLAAKAAEKGGGLHWQSSIVDLLKVLDLDSSLSARKELAAELDVHAGADGSAEENVALHRAVVAKLAENGGTLPAEMKA